MENNFAYTRTNRIIEFQERDSNYWKFMALKLIAFLIDIISVIAIELVMMMLFGGFFNSFMLTSIIGVSYYVMYNMFFMFIFNGQTLGMRIVKLKALHKSGFKTNRSLLLVRGLITGLYAMPIVGWAMMISSFISTLIYRGVSMIDIITATATVSLAAYAELSKIEDELLKENLGENYE